MTLFFQLLLFDLFAIVFCAYLLFRFARISFLHPATIYFVFHILGFSWRLLSLASGAERLFAGRGEAITDAEYLRATVIADIGLFIMTVAWIKASKDDLNKKFKSGRISKGHSAHLLSPEAIWLVTIPAFFIGLIGLLYFSALPGGSAVRAGIADLGAWSRSTWATGTQMWSGVALLILVYRYGFRSWILLPMMAFLVIMGYQGYHRFRVIIPALLLLQFYVSRHGRKWPSVNHILLISLLFLLWFPLKTVGNMARQGASVSDITNRSVEIISSSVRGDNELVFLDYLAASMTLRDQHGKFFYFKTYVPLITLSIPRPIWENKPRIAFYLDEISTSRRPMAQWGAIVTLYGESYISFGYFGIVVVPYLLAYIFGRFYFAALSKPFSSVFRLAYLVFCSSLLLVYRDGVPSLVVFTAATMMPFMFLFLLSFFLRTDDDRVRQLHTRISLRYR